MCLNDLGKRILLFDGALGTLLMQGGLKAGILPETLNLTSPDVIVTIHRAYLEAGCDIITANTFGANALKLKDSGYTVRSIVRSGVRLAREAGAKTVALDVGSLGALLAPLGTLPFEEAVSLFAEPIREGVEADVDAILIETMTDLYEAKAAVTAAREICDLPVFCTMSFEQNGRTFMGCDPLTAAVALESYGVDALGVNCSLGPALMIPVVDILLRSTRLPIIVQPNAGLPSLDTETPVYTLSDEAFVETMIAFARLGVSVMGGCCGTTPRTIRLLRQAVEGIDPPERAPVRLTAVTSGTRTHVFNGQLSVIGERVNPTGKKRLKEALRNRDMSYILGEAVAQDRAGADVLDVNCGLPDIDESALLPLVVQEIQDVSACPLQIDSSDPKAIENALRVYNGKACVNSVNGKAESLDSILPLIKKYGALVVGLTLDENGIPATGEGRLDIARRIVETAERYGIPRENIIIDCLVLTAGAEQAQVMECLRAVSLVKNELGVVCSLGVSNVSFGLPSREALNSAYLAAGVGLGLDAAILNPLSDRMMETVRALRVLGGNDVGGRAYIESYGGRQAEAAVSAPASNGEVSREALGRLILDGRREESARVTEVLLATLSPLEVINQIFVPALDEAGRRYDRGQFFLPQLLQSAEAVKAGFELCQARMPDGGASRGKILLATVRGDIHDIGKNIAAMLLRNYGFEVVDLGRDVRPEVIVDAVRETGARLVGLSALMTTSVAPMRETIERLRSAGLSCKICVGGAVLSDQTAELVGADYYAPDAMAGVRIAQSLFASDSAS